MKLHLAIAITNYHYKILQLHFAIVITFNVLQQFCASTASALGSFDTNLLGPKNSEESNSKGTGEDSAATKLAEIIPTNFILLISLAKKWLINRKWYDFLWQTCEFVKFELILNVKLLAERVFIELCNVDARRRHPSRTHWSRFYMIIASFQNW